jgi:multiple sugar transport system substrate-binding protein
VWHAATGGVTVKRHRWNRPALAARIPSHRTPVAPSGRPPPGREAQTTHPSAFLRGFSARPPSALVLGLGLVAGCTSAPAGGPAIVTFPGSALGAEGRVLQRQLARFMAGHPNIRVVQRPTPDAADQRHQLYVQWLNAQASEPDILQLDVVWTPEFAAAGWILDLDRFRPATDSFFPATIAANRWQGRLYAMPWFVDVGMLYWRTDLMAAPPATFAQLERIASDAQARRGLRYGLVWHCLLYTF